MNLVTHYYRKGDTPFQSVSDLDYEVALKHIKTYDTEEALVYRRFHNPEKYLTDRKKVESWLLREFEKKGGMPKRANPYYLVLGESSYIFEGYNKNCEKIQIPINKINPKEISFTYPDSMVSYWLKTEKSNEPFYQPSYHGKVFTLDEISTILSSLEHYENVWNEVETRKFDFFIEGQFWCDDISIYIG